MVRAARPVPNPCFRGLILPPHAGVGVIKFLTGGHHVPEVRVSLGELVSMRPIEFSLGKPTKPTIL